MIAYLIAAIPIAFLIGCFCPGIGRRIKEKIKGPLYTKFTDIKTQLEQAVTKDEAALKADVAKVIAKIERVLP